MSDTVLTSDHLRPTLTLVKILSLSFYLTTTLNDYTNESSYKILILVTCEDRSYTRCRATRYIRRRVIAHLSNHRDRDIGRQRVSTSGSHSELVGFLLLLTCQTVHRSGLFQIGCQFEFQTKRFTASGSQLFVHESTTMFQRVYLSVVYSVKGKLYFHYFIE